MSLKDQLKEDVKLGMKAGEKAKVAVIRMLLSELQYAQTAGDAAKELSDQDCLKAIQAYHKKLAKSLDDFSDEAKKAVIKSEMAFVEIYLPKKAGESETLKAVKEVLAHTQDRNFGALMKQVMTKLGESGDGALISKILKSELN
jgi:uncharacterized protein YqeY